MTKKDIHVKHVFLDVVGYSRRPTEAQVDIINVLNKTVMDALIGLSIVDSFDRDIGIDIDRVILLPVGDAICISLLDSGAHEFDAHIKLALKILELIYNHNRSTTGQKFDVRIGIDENTDTLFADINDNKNVAGAGINYAQRIMNVGDARHILVGGTVYNQLRHRQGYMNQFRSFNVPIKHNEKLDVYQFVDPSITYLNSEVPESLRSEPENEIQFSKLIAYYIAHLVKNKDFITENATKGARKTTSTFILMLYLAMDSVDISEKGKYKMFISRLPSDNLEKNLREFAEINFVLMLDYSQQLFKEYIYPYSHGSMNTPSRYFADKTYCLEITEEAIEKLKKEWPGIASEFGIK